MASRVAVGQVWASNHRGDRDANVRQHREVVAVQGDRAVLATMPVGRRATVRLNVSGDRTTIPNHRLIRAASSNPSTAEHEAAEGLSADALLARVHERIGGLGVDIRTFGESGQIEIHWKRDYAGVWSDERFLTADSLSAALRAILDHENQADREDAATAAREEAD